MHADKVSHMRLVVKPQMAGRCPYALAMGKPVLEVLRDNLLALKDAGVGPAGQLALARRAGVGESTISRARRAEGNTTIQNLEAIGKAVRLEAWQLLVLDLDPTSPPRIVSGRDTIEVEAAPTVEVFDVKLSLSALEVARAWEHLPPDRKLALKQKIIAESLRHREDYVPDEKLGHLAAPAKPARGRKRRKASTPGDSGTN